MIRLNIDPTLWFPKGLAERVTFKWASRVGSDLQCLKKERPTRELARFGYVSPGTWACLL